MEKTRVPKGEKYWYISTDWLGKIVVYRTEDVNMVKDRNRFEIHNYFATQEEALSMTKKLRAVLKGAEVIEMPSDEELRKNLPYQQFTRWSDGELGERNGWRECYRWFKSKIVK